MTYGRVYESLWNDPAFQGLSDDGKLMELYLRTCPHRKRLGLFVLHPMYAAADLQWEPTRIDTALSEVEAAGRIRWDGEGRVVFVRDMLRLQPLDNPNQVKAALNELQAVPYTPLLRHLLEVANADSRPHCEPLRTTIQARISASKQGTEGVGTKQPKGSANGLPKGSSNGSGNDSETVGQTQALPSQPSPSLTLPSPSGSLEFETPEDVWDASKDWIIEGWHRGKEEIQVNGKSVGMGAEKRNVQHLVARYGAEETYGAILIGPKVLRLGEPISLRLYTDTKVGPGNFRMAVGQWHKDQGVA